MTRYILALILSMTFLAGASADAPELTEVQKLKIQNLTQRIEIAQLRAQAAQREFEAARNEITQLIQTLQVEGYTLSLETLSYTKNPEPPKEK